MAKNGAKGGGRRGAIRNRTQFQLPDGHYAKRDTRTGEIISVKADLKPYKGVVKEKHPPTATLARSSQPARRMGSIRRLNLQPVPSRTAWYTRQVRRRDQAERASTIAAA
jgi:hypothetical protein